MTSGQSIRPGDVFESVTDHPTQFIVEGRAEGCDCGREWEMGFLNGDEIEGWGMHADSDLLLSEDYRLVAHRPELLEEPS